MPGNYTAPTQPYPTRPELLDPIVVDGLTEDYVLDFTPELKREALEILREFRVGGLYVLSRCLQNSCTGRSEPALLKLDPSGRLLLS